MMMRNDIRSLLCFARPPTIRACLLPPTLLFSVFLYPSAAKTRVERISASSRCSFDFFERLSFLALRSSGVIWLHFRWLSLLRVALPLADDA